INLTRVPYLIAIGAKPSQYLTANEGDWLYALNGNAPLNISWNNVPGKCSTFTPQQLYNISRSHGLQDSFLTWSGTVANKYVLGAAGQGTASTIPLAGGWILLQAGIDFSLDDISLSPGSVCNLSMTVSLNVKNQTGIDYSGVQSNFYVFCLYNDFVETDTVMIKSQVISGIIDSHAVLSADKTQPSASENELMQKYLGGGVLHNMRRAHRRHHKKLHKKYHSRHGGKMIAGAKMGGDEPGGKRRVSHRRFH
ncbi:MAG: hypothetical protein P4L41_05585, partial [Flavipsychrobacter sp.]|nr:hypothetical protein [Flavipsychrobacter sp.]